MPKIAVYSSEKMEELITLVEEDRQRADEHRRYKVRIGITKQRQLWLHFVGFEP